MNSVFETYLGSLKREIAEELIQVYKVQSPLFIATIWQGGFPVANLNNDQPLPSVIQGFLTQCNGLSLSQLRRVFSKLSKENPGCKSLRQASKLLEKDNGSDHPPIEERVTEYLEEIKPNLIKQGCSDRRNYVNYEGKTFRLIARTTSFKVSIGGIPMRGEAFFIFSHFPSLNENSLRDFSTYCLDYAKQNANPSTSWQSLWDFKAPANICFSTAITEQIDEKTKKQIKETNPFGETVDLLWYNIPIIYTLNDRKIYFYQEPLKSKPWEFFRGEVVWKELRKIVNQTLINRF